MRCPNCNKEMSDFIDVYKCCYCDLQIEKTVTEQQKFDELNQKWLEAIKDWKGIIAEKDEELKFLKFQNELLKKVFKIACHDLAIYMNSTTKKVKKILLDEVRK